MIRHSYLFAGLTAAVLLSSACGAEPSTTASATVEVLADYPSYDEDQLFESATLIVEATVMSAANTVLMPQFEGDTEEENPLVGLDVEGQEKALAEAEGVPGTAVILRVDVVHKGLAGVGQEIVIMQTGGVIDGVTYAVSAEEPLQIEQSYLLFAVEGRDGTYSILGGSAGSYMSDGTGQFVAVNPDVAPFAQIDRANIRVH